MFFRIIQLTEWQLLFCSALNFVIYQAWQLKIFQDKQTTLATAN